MHATALEIAATLTRPARLVLSRQVYEATLAAPLTGEAARNAEAMFESGSLLLVGDDVPLLPARLEMMGDTCATVRICEGRYHQVRRMFTAVGHDVVALRRVAVGGLSCNGLADGEWRQLSAGDVEAVFNGPTEDEIFGREAVRAGS
eukprot:347384-Chlamydomonas_euryale.AAC.3